MPQGRVKEKWACQRGGAHLKRILTYATLIKRNSPFKILSDIFNLHISCVSPSLPWAKKYSSATTTTNAKCSDVKLLEKEERKNNKGGT